MNKKTYEINIQSLWSKYNDLIECHKQEDEQSKFKSESIDDSVEFEISKAEELQDEVLYSLNLATDTNPVFLKFFQLVESKQSEYITYYHNLNDNEKYYAIEMMKIWYAYKSFSNEVEGTVTIKEALNNLGVNVNV
jgi:DNA-directed RNA polymerase subunit N (RpoN/RPB10)